MVPRLLPLGVRSAIVSETRTRVLAEVDAVAERFISAGFPVYLVGGIVRDLELGAGIDELDFDLTTTARPDQIRLLIDPIADAVWSQGERFGTIGCMVGGREYEITTHRAEWYSGTSRKPDVVFGDDIVADLSRRDFTINAMAIELPGGAVIDPFDGRIHLRERRLITPIEARVSFADDPLRILRAARFIARYDLDPAPDVVGAAGDLVDRMEIVSAERVRVELDKLLLSKTPSRGLRFLEATGALEHVLPALDRRRLDSLCGWLDAGEPDLELRRLVLFSAVPADRRPDQIAALRYSKHEQRDLDKIVEALDDIADERPDEWSDERVRRLVARVGFSRVETLFALGRVVGAPGSAESAFRTLREREDLASLEPVLGGADVMDALGLDEGPRVGEIVDALRERRLRDGPATRDEELAYLTRLEATDEPT